MEKHIFVTWIVKNVSLMKLLSCIPNKDVCNKGGKIIGTLRFFFFDDKACFFFTPAEESKNIIYSVTLSIIGGDNPENRITVENSSKDGCYRMLVPIHMIQFDPNDMVTLECKIDQPNGNLSYIGKQIYLTEKEVKRYIFEFLPELYFKDGDWDKKRNEKKVFESEDVQVLYYSEYRDDEKTFVRITVKKSLPKTPGNKKVGVICKIYMRYKTFTTCKEGIVGTLYGQNNVLDGHFRLDMEDGNLLCKKSAVLEVDLRYSDGERELNSKNNDSLPKSQLFTAVFHSVDQTDYQTRILSNLCKDKKFTDVTLRAGTNEFPAHKCVLDAASPVFAAMFKNDMLEKETNIVSITDLDSETVNRMLQFLYDGTFKECDVEGAMKLYTAANKYQIRELEKACSAYISTSLRIENICDVLEFADLHQDSTMEKDARAFVLSNHKAILKLSSWKSLMERRLQLAADLMLKINLDYS